MRRRAVRGRDREHDARRAGRQFEVIAPVGTDVDLGLGRRHQRRHQLDLLRHAILHMTDLDRRLGEVFTRGRG